MYLAPPRRRNGQRQPAPQILAYSPMKDLIVKLEAATEGSRELDAYIWAAINGRGQPVKIVGPPTYKTPRLFCNPNPEVEWIGYDLLTLVGASEHHYTASLDAALTLVPEGCWVSLIIATPASAEVNPNNIREINGKTYAATPALALCAALLKARAA